MKFHGKLHAFCIGFDSEMPRNPEDLDPSRGARVKALRGDERQQDIADRVGVTVRAVAGWEAGEGIAKRNRAKLAQALQTTVSYIMTGEETPSTADGAPDELVERLSRQQEILRRVASNRLLTAEQLAFLEQALDELERGQPEDEADASEEGGHRAA